MMPVYNFSVKLWKYKGHEAWYFVTVPKKYADEIKLLSAGYERSFGSLKVEVKSGNTKWLTSIFPDSKAQSYILPVKKQVRQAL